MNNPNEQSVGLLPTNHGNVRALSVATGSPYGLSDYRDSMVEARRERDGLSSQLLAQSIDASEWLDAVASALGIQVGRESWWEGSEEDRRQKILARIKRLRANNQLRNAGYGNSAQTL